MPFTKREQRRGNVAIGIALSLLAIVILGSAFGCGEGTMDLTLHDTQVFLENGNAKGRMMLRVNGSPLSFNTTHSLGPSLTIEFDGKMDFTKGKPEPE